MNSFDKHECPLTCPNRQIKQLGKGYSFLFSLAVTALLVWQSVNIKYNKNEGWQLESKEVPLALLIPCAFLIAGALGINTDPLAQTLGKILSKHDNNSI